MAAEDLTTTFFDIGSPQASRPAGPRLTFARIGSAVEPQPTELARLIRAHEAELADKDAEIVELRRMQQILTERLITLEARIETAIVADAPADEDSRFHPLASLEHHQAIQASWGGSLSRHFLLHAGADEDE